MQTKSATHNNPDQIAYRSLWNAALHSNDGKLLKRLESVPAEMRWGGRELPAKEVIQELQTLKALHSDC